jgi:hypothetical protein
MPRLGRYFLPDQPQHVIQRGNDRQAERNGVRVHFSMSSAIRET